MCFANTDSERFSLTSFLKDNEKLDEFVRANNFIGWFATSALDNLNVDEAMKFLVRNILEVSKRVKIERPGAQANQSNSSSSISVVSQQSYDPGIGKKKKKDDDSCCA